MSTEDLVIIPVSYAESDKEKPNLAYVLDAREKFKPKVCPLYSLDQVLEEREESDFPEEVREVVDLITIQEDVLPVGSAKFKIHKYPSDVDIFEQVEGCCTVNEVRFQVKKKLQDIVNSVLNASDTFIADFKAGFDKRYDVYIGEEDHGVIVDYDPAIAKREVDNLFGQGLLSREEYNKLSAIIKKSEEGATLEQFNEINDTLRKHYVLRWSPKEILDGFKVLPGNKKMYLDDALIDHSVVKLDLWAVLPYTDIPERCLKEYYEHWEDSEIPRRLTEVTNWLLIMKKDKKGESTILTQELPNYAKSLRHDIIKYAPNNPLKSIKRLWSYLIYLNKTAATEDVNRLLINLAPLFSSYIAFLNSIKGDMEIIETLRKSPKLNVSDNFFRQTIDSLILRVKCAAPDCEFDPEVNNEVLALLEESRQNLNNVSKTVEYLKDVINEMTTQALQDRGIDIEEILASL